VTDSDDQQTHGEFSAAVNMTAKELERWLDTDQAQEVGQKKDAGAESTGHEAGRRIVAILGTKKADLSQDDYAHMRKVVGYVKRHSAQRPDGDVSDTRWRYSLMNWGHDPLK
jgi:DNA topoisomerase VI subunit B